ncbi:MAG: hypothetical protein D6816_19615, partial [Bacteroidetes bacterium]
MSKANVKNLDYLAAKHAQGLIGELGENAETPVTKALGVLQENGVYACFLYLYAREKDGGKIAGKMVDLLNEALLKGEEIRSENSKEILENVADKITGKGIERLLLARELLEQMLIYARYGAKAAAGNEQKKNQSS